MEADGLGQGGQGLLVEAFAGLLEPRLYLGDGEEDGASLLGLEGGIPQQGAQASSQAPF